MLDRLYMPLQELSVKVGRRSGGYSMHKALMALMGHPDGPPRPQTLPLSPAHRPELREILLGRDWPVAEMRGSPAAHTTGVRKSPSAAASREATGTRSRAGKV